EDLNNLRAKVRYTARGSVAEIARVVHLKALRQGNAVITGEGQYIQPAGLSMNGTLHATGVEYRDASLRLTDVSAQSSIALNARGISASHLELSGNYVKGNKREHVDGRIADLALRHQDLEAKGVALALLNGTFHGDAQV